MALKKNKTFTLVGLLDNSENHAFERELATHKRNTLLPLYKILRKLAQKGQALDKEQVYQQLYKSPYAAEKDFLLRNELRLLGEALVAFVAQATMNKQWQQDDLARQQHYLQWLAGKPAFELLEAEAKASFDGTGTDAGISAKMLRIFIEGYIQHREATLENYEELIGLMHRYYQYESTDFLQRMIEIKHKQAFAERTLMAVTNGQYEVSPLQETDLAWHDSPNGYVRYMVLLTESYRENGQAKVAHLLQAREVLNEVEKAGFDKPAAASSLAAGIALEYFLLGEYHESVKWHREALTNGKAIAPEKLITYVFNYLSTLIRLEAYQEAIGIIEEHRRTWQGLPRMRDRFRCLLAMCHIFNHNHEAAWDCIPMERKQGGIDHYYYYRSIHIIVLLRRGHYTLAETETDNFIHTIRYQDKDAGYLKFLQILKKYIKAESEKRSVPAATQQERLEEIRSLLQQHQKILNQPDKALLYRWICKETE